MPLQNAAFSKSEYDRRIAKTRAAMEAEGIDVLFATDPSNQAWLTGYDGWSFTYIRGQSWITELTPSGGDAC